MRIDIRYDLAKAERSKKRWDAAFNLSVADLPPICWGVTARTALARRRSSFAKMFADPVSQLEELVENMKWILENVPGDHLVDSTVVVQPQFENAPNSNAFDCPVMWDANQPPQAMSAIHSLKELESYRPPPIEETLWWKQIEFYRAMRKHVDEGHIEVVIGGERVRIDVQVHIGGESPFCVATDLCGCNVFEWIYEAPDLMHRLLDLITTRMIETELMMRDICGAKKTGRIVLSDDSAQVVSIDDYREFVVPYTGRIYDTFAPGKNDRVMHLCGRHIHLYPALINDLRVEGMWGAGSRNTPEELRDVAGGRVWIVGNLDPMLLCDGPAELIAAETRRLLSALLPCGGLIVGDGYNVIPETPIRHLQVVEETVRAFCI